MTNFIFKSSGLIKNVYFKLEAIQTELRYQRSEHRVILRKLDLLLHQQELEDQVSSYYKKYGEDETSPQTEPETPPEETDHL